LLFFPPLMIFQLFVIWGTRHYLLDDSKQQPHVETYATMSKEDKEKFKKEFCEIFPAMSKEVEEKLFPEKPSENKTPKKNDEQENDNNLDNILLLWLTLMCLVTLIFIYIIYYF
jgi:hypothetical protein